MIGVMWVVRALLVNCAIMAAGFLIPRFAYHPVSAERETHTLHVIASPIHTDIVIPIDAPIIKRLKFRAAANIPLDQPSYKWLVIGWGGGNFYTEIPRWSDLKAIPVLKSLTVDRSVLHITAVGSWCDEFTPIRTFRVEDAGYEQLLRFIESSFAREDSHPVALPGGSSWNDGRVLCSNRVVQHVRWLHHLDSGSIAGSGDYDGVVNAVACDAVLVA